MAISEITRPVDLCRSDGSLNRRAVGYSRRPLHTTNLRGWGRNKRWEYWGLVTPTHFVGITVSSLDYAAVSQLYAFDRRTGQEIVEDTLALGSSRTVLPDHPAPLTAGTNGSKLTITLTDREDGTQIRVSSARLTVDALAEPGGDCLAVVVPWNGRRFQYTVKDVGRPLVGEVVIDGERVAIPAGESFAVLDRGRGVWPYRLSWNWGAGAAVLDGKRIGLQVGGKWTDGTGSTENGLIVDGKLTYWPDALTWDYDRSDWYKPWHVSGPNVDATLTPIHVRDAGTNVGIIASSVHQAFGTWRGTATDAAGQEYKLDGLTGWAEEANNRW